MFAMTVSARDGKCAGFIGVPVIFTGDGILMMSWMAGVISLIQTTPILFMTLKLSGGGYVTSIISIAAYTRHQLNQGHWFGCLGKALTGVRLSAIDSICVNQLGTSQLKQIPGLHIILISTTRWNCRFSGIKPTVLSDKGCIEIDPNHFTDGEPALAWHTIEALKLSDLDHATFKCCGTLSNTWSRHAVRWH